jgi:hypothetical protein
VEEVGKRHGVGILAQAAVRLLHPVRRWPLQSALGLLQTAQSILIISFDPSCSHPRCGLNHDVSPSRSVKEIRKFTALRELGYTSTVKE